MARNNSNKFPSGNQTWWFPSTNSPISTWFFQRTTIPPLHHGQGDFPTHHTHHSLQSPDNHFFPALLLGAQLVHWRRQYRTQEESISGWLRRGVPNNYTKDPTVSSLFDFIMAWSMFKFHYSHLLTKNNGRLTPPQGHHDSALPSPTSAAASAAWLAAGSGAGGAVGGAVSGLAGLAKRRFWMHSAMWTRHVRNDSSPWFRTHFWRNSRLYLFKVVMFGYIHRHWCTCIYIYTICYTSYNLVYTPINYSYIYHILSFLWELYIYICA